MMQKLGNEVTDAEIKDIITESGSSKASGITYTEFQKLMGLGIKNLREPEDPEDELRHAFRLFDQDGDGTLTKDEVHKRLDEDDTIEELMSLAGKSLKNINEQLDADADGTVSRKEFIDMLTKQGFEYTFDWLTEQIVFQKENMQSRRLNILAIEEGYDASTVKADAEKCNATWNEETQRYERDLGDVFPVWALVFDMVEDRDGNLTDFITHEAVEVIQRMWELDLSVDVRRTIDKDEIIVLVGIPYVKMQQEAEEMGMKLRMTDTRGTLEYSTEFHDRFADYVRHPMDKNGEVFIDKLKGAEEGNFRCEQYATVRVEHVSCLTAPQSF